MSDNPIVPPPASVNHTFDSSTEGSYRTAGWLQPKRLHWGWVLLFDFLSGGIFGAIWLIVQTKWIARAKGDSRALPWVLAAAALMILQQIGEGAYWLAGGQIAGSDSFIGEPWLGILGVSVAAVRIAALFIVRSELEKNLFGLSLSGVMTFFFGGVYFQYHLQDYVFEDSSYVGARSFPM